jgi:thiol-disulfide isomerase/thioredoxin
MALTPSAMPVLESSAPEFNLYDTTSGKYLALKDLRSEKATVIMFICNHCPFVKHVNKELVRLAQDYLPKGISFIAISSNDPDSHPQDAPDKMKEHAKEMAYPFPYLFDATQEIAKAFQAECTPDFFIYDRDLKLRYRGQLDESRPSNDLPVTGKDIRNALDCLLKGHPVSPIQKPSIGCNIKRKIQTV